MENANLSHFLALLGRSSLEAGIVIVLVLATQWLFRKQLSPHWRCALWLLVVVRMLLLFSFGSATSVFNLLPHPPEPARLTGSTLVASPNLLKESGAIPLDKFSEYPAGEMSAGPSTLDQPAAHLAVAKAKTWSWPTAIFAVWLAGVLLLSGHILISSVRLQRRCARLKPLAQPETTALLTECCERLKVPVRPALLQSLEVTSPALVGLFRPCLLLPRGFTAGFSLDELRFVFLHELAHVKRRDLWMNWIVAGLQVMHWFNPLVWFGFARWRADRELACDALALEAAGEGQNKEYGRTILRLLENYAHPLATPGLVGILEDKRQLRRRIGMIASYVPTRGWPRLAVLLAGVLAVIGLTDAQTKSQSTTEAPALSPTVTITPSQQAPAATVPLIAPAIPAVISPAASSTIPATPTAASPPVEQPVSVPQLASNGASHDGEERADANSTPPQVKGYDMTTASTSSTSLTNHLIRAAAIGLLALASPATSPSLQAEDAPATVTAAPAESETALTGAWALAGQPGHVKDPPAKGGRIKIYAGNYWCMIQYDSKTGIIIFHHGGIFTLDGSAYHETVQFAGPTTMYSIGRTNGHFNVMIEGDQLTGIGIDNGWKEVWKRLKSGATSDNSPLAQNLVGAWAMTSSKNDWSKDPSQIGPLKLCAGGYWCDIQADAKTGIIEIHHGGTYTLKGDEYSETVEFADPSTMQLIGHTFHYNIKMEDGKLALTGIKNPWNEVWSRVE